MERSTCRPGPWILLAVSGAFFAATGTSSAQPSAEQLAARDAARRQALAAGHSSPITVVDGTPRPLPLAATELAESSVPATARGGDTDGRRSATSLTTVIDEAGMAVPLGGDDIVVATSANFSGSAFLRVLSDGTYVGAVAALGDVYVYKSTDKGESWTLWSTFSDPTGYVVWLPELLVAEGTLDRILFAYASAGEVRVAYADVYAPVPVWTIVTALANPGVTHGTGYRIDIDTDVALYGSYYVYLVAEGVDGDGDDIWFTRSLDMGSTFQPAYRIADSATGTYDSYTSPTICFGAGDYLHVAYISEKTSPSMLEDASYRRVPAWADGGAGSWEAPQTIYAQSGVDRALPIRIGAGITHGDVYLTMIRFTPGAIGQFRFSTDFGTSWPPLNTSSNIPIGGGMAPVETASGDLLLPGTFYFSPHLNVSIGRSTVAGPSIWAIAQSCSRNAWTGTPAFPRIEGLAVDPAFGNRWAVLWVHVTSTEHILRFDAEWRRDPGYPNTDVGFPIPVAGGGQTPPAVAEVDGDAEKEIVFGTISGDIHVVNHDGTSVPGWPVNIGGMPFDAPVAVGDLLGNGEVSIVAGTTSGKVVAFDPQGNELDGWPVDLGTGTNVYVSIGALGPPSTRYVVALSAKKVAIINFWGTNVAPAWIPPEIPFGTYSRPAAIGDVDDDGVTEIVSLAGPNVYYHQLGDPGYIGNQFPGENFSDAPTLADIDEDGDLEVAMPTASGKMYIHNPGDLPLPGWPVTVSPGVPLTSAAMAQFLGPPEADLAFGDANGNIYLYWFDGIAQTGYPKASGGTALYMPPMLTPVSDFVSSIAVGTTAAGTGTSQSWSNLGVVPTGWPKNLPGSVEETFASGDIDNDGRNEIVVLGVEFLTVLDVGTAPAVSSRNHWPMYGYNAQRTGCLACEEILVGVGDAPRTVASTIDAYPNPFNPVTTIDYVVARAGKVSLEIFDVGGHRVGTLIDAEPRDAGSYSLSYHATGASGVYFARLRTVDGEVTRKIVLLK